MKKFLSLMMTALCCSAAAWAQITVTGTVTSAADGEPLIGATVQPVGQSSGTATDIDGNFTLEIPTSVTTLRVSYVGMLTKEVPVTSGHMDIALSPSETRLDEVMVVAYGTSKRSEYTGSASVVSAAELSDVLVSSPTSALSGRVSGVQTLSSDGRPGGAASVRIRGVGSINASSSPLYVVDGVPFDGDMSNLPTTDIESMTVLKDAASTALYGARGANGVILITTKKGKEGNATVTFDARWGSNSRALDNYNVIKSTPQYMEQLYTAYYNGYVSKGSTPWQAWEQANNSIAPLGGGGGVLGYQIYTLPEGERLFGHNGKVNPAAMLGYSDGRNYYTPDDWTAETLRHGLRQEYNLGVSGGTEKFSYYLAASYLGDEGLIKGSSFQRLSTRATVDYQAKKWLKLGTNLSYVYTNTGYPGDNDLDSSTSSGNAFFVCNQIAPVYPMYIRDAEGKVVFNDYYSRPVYDYGDGTMAAYRRNFMKNSNPAGDLLYNTTEYLTDVFDGKWYAILTPLDGLTINGNVGYFVDNTRVHMNRNPFYGQSASDGGMAEQYQSRQYSLNTQVLASYNHTFGDVHLIDLMAGYENYHLESENVYAIGYNVYYPNGWDVTNTIDRKTGNGSKPVSYTTRGILFRAKYTYDGRYYFHASYRRDSSSRFAPDKRWGNFWSLSAGWDISKEAFMQDLTNVDMLKFKASFGQNGNDRLSASGDAAYYYAWQDQYQISGADGVWNDATLYFKGNKDITWETSNSLNVGFDFSFFQGRLDGSAEYFQRQTSNMLFNIPTAPSLGYSSYPANVGSMRNNGIEVELNGTVVNTRNITLDLNFNITAGWNKIIRLADYMNGEWINGSRIFTEGESMYQQYLVSYAGVDPESGQALYWARYSDDYLAAHPGTAAEFTTTNWDDCYGGNAKKNLVMNRKRSGNLMPKAYGGFGASLKAYGVDFSISFAYQFGGKVYDSGYQNLMHGSTTSYIGQNWHTDILNAWTPENRYTDVPRLCNTDNYSASTSDRFLVSSDYLSLNNITIGYTLPDKWTRQIGIQSLRVYGAAENVALWTKRKGLDPRQGYSVSNNATYSPIRCISGGIRLSF